MTPEAIFNALTLGRMVLQATALSEAEQRAVSIFLDDRVFQQAPERFRREVVLPLTVPPDARLVTAVGVHPARWVAYPALAVTFRVTVDGETVAERTLDPQRTVADRGWTELDVPLDRFAGRTVELGFSTATERPDAEALEMGGFALPRLVTSPDAR